MDLQIFPPEEMIEASVTLPLSKSMSARALIINKIQNVSPSIELSDSDDTKALVEGLGKTTGLVNVGAAGTAMRFLTAYYASTPGVDIIVDGSERMRERPMEPLIKALRDLGADIECLGNEGFAPMRIHGKRLSGGEVNVDPGISSQFLSALMMIAPAMESPLTICFEGDPVSLSYVKMTAAMMAEAGVEPDFSYGRIEIPSGSYTKPVDKIEKDWSAASYWYAIVAVSAGWITLSDMSLPSVQGDAAMVSYGEKLGVLTEPSEDDPESLALSPSPEQFSRLDLDMSQTPDVVQTLAFAAALLGIPFRFTGVGTLRDKETDRLTAMQKEARKLGLLFEIENDGNTIAWEGRGVPVNALPVFDTYSDHRMAMSLAPVALCVPGIIIRNSEVVTKSYPEFWNNLREVGFELKEVKLETVEE